MHFGSAGARRLAAGALAAALLGYGAHRASSLFARPEPQVPEYMQGFLLDPAMLDDAWQLVEQETPILMAPQEVPQDEPERAAPQNSCGIPAEAGSVEERIASVGCLYGIREDFLTDLWRIESNLQHTSGGEVKRSYAGAIGIGQVMPGVTGESIVDGHRLDAYDESDNVELGAQVLLRKRSQGVAIASANGFETRPASAAEPAGAIHYVCVGVFGNAGPFFGDPDGRDDVLIDRWYTAPEEVMARAYNGVSCGGDLLGYMTERYGTERGGMFGRVASCATMYYVEKVFGRDEPAACVR
ncbi:lytic transglycosylase domain-containing protein [Candidatus Woesearchaeota archaeon]|nr:lytic transglycosylase domain-containing protein [Candidatus Woesearchaeota archaeon]